MTMKKILLTLVTVISLMGFVQAEEGGVTLNPQFGAFYQKGFNAVLELEFESRYFHSWNVYLDFCNTFTYCENDHTFFCQETFWDYQTAAIGVAYKYELIRWRNANLKARLGFDLGADYCKKDDYTFYMSADVGFELSYTLRNRVQLSLIQKNDFCFLTRDHFKNGLLVGIKIPLN